MKSLLTTCFHQVERNHLLKPSSDCFFFHISPKIIDSRAAWIAFQLNPILEYWFDKEPGFPF